MTIFLNIMTFEAKQLVRCGHVQKMNNTRMPRKYSGWLNNAGKEEHLRVTRIGNLKSKEYEGFTKCPIELSETIENGLRTRLEDVLVSIVHIPDIPNLH